MTPNTFTQRGVPVARPASARESRLGSGSAMACLGPVIVTGRQFTKHGVDVKSKRSGRGRYVYSADAEALERDDRGTPP
jgi:hypothetical protein